MSEDRRHNRAPGNDRPLAELLSAYLDDRDSLSSSELARVERLLDEDPTARRMHAELGVIRQELRSLESIPAPRAYHLDAEMLGLPEPVILRETQAWYARHTETVRWATAAAAILFVFVLGVDLISSGAFSGTGDEDFDAAPEQAEIMSRMADDDDAAAEALEEEASDGEAALETYADEAGDDAGESEEAPPVVTPEVAEDAASGAEEAEDEAAATAPDPVEEEEEAAGGADQPEATAETEAAVAATEQARAPSETMAFDADDSGAADEGSDRRLWRIAEFSLVVLVTVLITAMIVLPRLGRRSARTAND